MQLENYNVIKMDERNNRRLKEYECGHCKATLYEGYEEVIKFEDEVFCDESCLGQFLLENTEYEVVTL